MKKNSITNKITPCCSLPFSVAYWWVSNLTLNSEADRDFVLSKINQNGSISIDAWKVLINSGVLEDDAILTKAEFLDWFNYGNSPNCEQLKLIIENYQIGSFLPEAEIPANVALLDYIENGISKSGNVYSKNQINQKLAEIQTLSFGGEIDKTDDPNPTDKKWFFLSEGGIYPNLNGLIADENKINIAIFDGTDWEVLKIEIPKEDVSRFDDALFYTEDNLEFSETNSENANGVALSAIIDSEIQSEGKISKIKGNFPAVGNLVLFVVNSKTLVSGEYYNFTCKKVFSVAIPTVGNNEIDISKLNIKVSSGDFLGVSTASTSKPFYGIDATFGKDWYQNASAIQEGKSLQFTKVNDASFAIGFDVIKEKLLERNEFDELKNELISSEKVYDLPIESGGSAPVLLGNLFPAPKDGIIKQIRFKANIVGIAEFQIFERTSFNSTPTGGGGDNFKGGKKFQVQATSVGFGTYILDEEVEIKKGELIALCSGAGQVSPSFTTEGTNHLGWFNGGSGGVIEGDTIYYTLQNGTIMIEYWLETRLFEVKKGLIVNKIIAVKNPENYNSIRDLIKTITDADEFNQYEIFVPSGTWNEFDWSGKKGVKIIGDISGKTIINLDPDGTMKNFLVPENFHFVTEQGKQLKDVVQYARHIVYIQDDIHCENLTFKAKNSKYCLHIDNQGYKKAYFKNCRMIDDNCNYPVGMGINGGQIVEFDRCILTAINSGKLGFFYHNWNNQTKANEVTFNRCKFENCGFGMVDELGSGQSDLLNVYNCFTTLGTGGQNFVFMVDITSDNKTYWINPATGTNEPNPINVPYCIVLNTTGTKVSSLTSVNGGNFNPAWASIPVRYIEVVKEISFIEL